MGRIRKEILALQWRPSEVFMAENMELNDTTSGPCIIIVIHHLRITESWPTAPELQPQNP